MKTEHYIYFISAGTSIDRFVKRILCTITAGLCGSMLTAGVSSCCDVANFMQSCGVCVAICNYSVSILAQVFEPIGCRCDSLCCHIAGEAMVSLGGVTRAMGVESDDPSMLRRLPDGARCAETMLAFGAVLEDSMMERLLQPTILLAMRQQFDKHRAMLDVLDAYRPWALETMRKEPVQVERAAGVVWEWLSDEGGSLLGFLQVLCNGGIPYSATFLDNVRRFASGIKAMTMTKVEYQSIMVAWLCFGGRVAPPVDCAPTQMETDASSSDDGSCPSMVGPVTADDIHFACYRQHMRSMAAPLNAVASSTLAMARQSRDAIRVHAMVPDPSDSVLAVGGTSVESQSRGAIHVHSAAPSASSGNTGVNFFSAFHAEESYRPGIAGNRHVEALSMHQSRLESRSRGAMHVHCMVWPEHVAAQTLMDAGVSPIHDCSNAQL